MFNQQQKPAFKFIIRSKLDEEKQKDEQSRDQSIAKPISKLQPSGLLPDRKRKRSDKDNTTSAPPIATKKIHSQLERWNKKKEELKVDREMQEEEHQAKTDYADLSALICLLCQRKFKTKADLEKHQAVSELHKNNLNDPVAVNKAKLKLNFLQSDQNLQREVKEQQQPTEYRNRAAERRQAYGQPEKPVLSPPPPAPRQLAVSRELTALPKASMHTPIGDDNKGARMLAKMGWNKGQGLGKDGSGIINPIKAESYAQSAGIGATTKRDLSSMDDSYKNRTMDVARKRLFGDD